MVCVDDHITHKHEHLFVFPPNFRVFFAFLVTLAGVSSVVLHRSGRGGPPGFVSDLSRKSSPVLPLPTVLV